jgi:hypothetical protein
MLTDITSRAVLHHLNPYRIYYCQYITTLISSYVVLFSNIESTLFKYIFKDNTFLLFLFRLFDFFRYRTKKPPPDQFLDGFFVVKDDFAGNEIERLAGDPHSSLPVSAGVADETTVVP